MLPGLGYSKVLSRSGSDVGTLWHQGGPGGGGFQSVKVVGSEENDRFLAQFEGPLNLEPQQKMCLEKLANGPHVPRVYTNIIFLLHPNCATRGAPASWMFPDPSSGSALVSELMVPVVEAAPCGVEAAG